MIKRKKRWLTAGICLALLLTLPAPAIAAAAEEDPMTTSTSTSSVSASSGPEGGQEGEGSGTESGDPQEIPTPGPAEEGSGEEQKPTEEPQPEVSEEIAETPTPEPTVTPEAPEETPEPEVTEEPEEVEEAEPDEELEKEKEKPVSLEYRTHVQTYGWQSWKKGGQLSGTTGKSKRLEGIQIRLKDAGKGDYIEYRTHVQSYGWEKQWVRNGRTSGTVGKAKRLEAIQIRLSPKLAERYDIYYSVHAQSYGWLNWAVNGAPAGTAGQSKRLEAIKIKLVKKGGAAPAKPGNFTQAYVSQALRYTTHVQSYGWRGWSTDGRTSGTEGQGTRLEGIKIELKPDAWTDLPAGSIEYRTHVQKKGWEKTWKRDGEVSGTVGKALRLEAIQIRLTGDLAKKYNVFYRVHAQSYGWLGWASNGESAGTEGLGRRLEAIQIRLLPKGAKGPGSSAGAFRKPMSRWKVPYAQPVNGVRTLKNLLRTALVPCGRTLWVWGGGHGADANIMGMPASWQRYFEANSKSDYYCSLDTISYWNGPDCSGYMSWVLANAAYTTSHRLSGTLMAEYVPQTYASYGWGTLIGRGNQTYKPGDIACMDYGHVWICLGQYEDGSVILVHNSTKGVQISGTGGTAHKRAGYYMKKYFPYWPYPAMKVDWYKGYWFKMRWYTNGRGLLTDPDGIQKMHPDQVLKLLLGD